MNKQNLFFIQHEECREIEGYSRGIIYDLNRNEYHLIPLDLIAFLRKINKTSKIDIKNKILNSELFDNYSNFIFDNELGFYCDKEEVSFFSNLDLIWKEPSYISNCLIDYAYFNSRSIVADNFISFFNKLDNLLIKHISIRFDDFTIDKLNEVEEVLKIASLFSFRGINIHFSTNEIIDTAYSSRLSSFFNNNNQVVTIIVNCRQQVLVESTRNIIFNDKSTNTNVVPHFISNVSLNLFLESQTHHPYFNRKLYIGADGTIKNAPECETSFDSIDNYDSSEELQKVINSSSFQKYWNIKKDVMDVCKDCEFRYMCVDNRLPYKRNENEWFHSIECNYNPYICKWTGDEDYKNLSECGIISNEKGFSIDHERIAKINETLWGVE